MLTLTYGGDDQRITCPHEGQAAPTAVTVTVLDERGATVLAVTPADLGDASTTLTAAASRGDTVLAVLATTGVEPGEVVALGVGTHEVEIAEVIGVTASTLTLRERLARSYPSGTAVETATIYHDLDATDTDDYPAGSYYQAIFDSADWAHPRGLVFRLATRRGADCPITYEDVRQWLPHVSSTRDAYDAPSLDEARESAWAVISARLRASGRDPVVWRDKADVGPVGGLLAAAVYCLAHGRVELAHELAGEPIGSGGIWAGYWTAFEAAPAWFDANEDGIRQTGEARTRGSRTLRRGL